MIPARRPLFEVVTPAADAAARALTTAANVRALIGSPTGDDATLTTLIDRASSRFAGYCKLASDAAGTFPTFGEEACRATWASIGFSNPPPYRPLLGVPDRLILPWRKPIAMTDLNEDGTDLVLGTDYQLVPGGMLERLDGNGAPKLWSTGIIVATFTAGYELPAGVPPDLEEACIQQVKYAYQSRKRDDGLKSVNAVDIVAYSLGSDTVGKSGLLADVESKLAAYKDWSQG